MKHLHTWGAIFVIVFASVVGDVLLTRAMKQVGDVHALLRRSGLWTVAGRVLSNQNFVLASRGRRRGFSTSICRDSPRPAGPRR